MWGLGLVLSLICFQTYIDTLTRVSLNCVQYQGIHRQFGAVAQKWADGVTWVIHTGVSHYYILFFIRSQTCLGGCGALGVAVDVVGVVAGFVVVVVGIGIVDVGSVGSVSAVFDGVV